LSKTISVIIPTYNYAQYLDDAVNSALSQTLPPKEVIVVDDGSTDNTESVLRMFGDKIRYFKQENAGVSAARNRGFGESTGDFIAFFDADDIWELDKLEKQLTVFDMDHEIGLVHCGMREFDSETGQTIALHLDGQGGWAADELLLWERPVIVGPGGTIIVRREAIQSVNGFDERFKVGEDWDFCYRVARKYKVGFVPEPLVNYRRHSAAAHLNIAEMERGMSLFYQKAFSADGDVLHLKDRALGNFYRILAGSYFQERRYTDFLKNAMKSIWHRPSGFTYFLKYPLRKLK
jgi:glycosyltransferase involved in cell wall biosynthesis